MADEWVGWGKKSSAPPPQAQPDWTGWGKKKPVNAPAPIQTQSTQPAQSIDITQFNIGQAPTNLELEELAAREHNERGTDPNYDPNPVDHPRGAEAIANEQRAQAVRQLPPFIQQRLAESEQVNPNVGTLEDGPRPDPFAAVLGAIPARGGVGRALRSGLVATAEGVVEPLANIASPLSEAVGGPELSGAPEGLGEVFNATDPPQTPQERIGDVVGRIGSIPVQFAAMGGLNPVGAAVQGVGRSVPAFLKLPAELATLTAIQQGGRVAAHDAPASSIPNQMIGSTPEMVYHAAQSVPAAIQAAGQGQGWERAANITEAGEPALALAALAAKDKVPSFLRRLIGGKRANQTSDIRSDGRDVRPAETPESVSGAPAEARLNLTPEQIEAGIKSGVITEAPIAFESIQANSGIANDPAPPFVKPAPAPQAGKGAGEANLPPWLSQTIDANYQIAERAGLVKTIEDLSAQRQTAGQILNQIKDKLPQGDRLDGKAVIQSVRSKLGIPSMDEGSAFEQWINSRKPSPPAQPPAAPQAGKGAGQTRVPPFFRTKGLADDPVPSAFRGVRPDAVPSVENPVLPSGQQPGPTRTPGVSQTGDRGLGDNPPRVVQPWEMSRSDYMARGVAPLPENHPLRVAAEQAESKYRDALGSMMPAKLRHVKMDTATKKTTFGAAMEYQPHTIETALKSTAVPRSAKDAFRQAKLERDAAIEAAENAVDHRTLVERAISEGKIASHPDYPELTPRADTPGPVAPQSDVAVAPGPVVSSPSSEASGQAAPAPPASPLSQAKGLPNAQDVPAQEPVRPGGVGQPNDVAGIQTANPGQVPVRGVRQTKASSKAKGGDIREAKETPQAEVLSVPSPGTPPANTAGESVPPGGGRVPKAIASKTAMAEAVIERSKGITESLDSRVQNLKTPAVWIDHQLIKPDGKYEIQDGKLVKVQDLSKAGFEKNLDSIAQAPGGEGNLWGANAAAKKFMDDASVKKRAKEETKRKENLARLRKEEIERNAINLWKEDVAKIQLPKSQKQTIEIKDQKGKTTNKATGTAYGDFLVSKPDNVSKYDKEPWVVTHIGSGLGAGKAATKNQAIDIVRAYLHAGVDTKFKSQKEISDRGNAWERWIETHKALRFDTPPPEYLERAKSEYKLPTDPTEAPDAGTSRFPEVPPDPKQTPPKLYSGIPLEPVLEGAAKLPEMGRNIVAEVKESMQRSKRPAVMKAPDFIRRAIGSTYGNVAATGEAGENFAYKVKFAEEMGRIAGHKADMAIEKALSKSGLGTVFGRDEFLSIGKKIENGEPLTPKQQIVEREFFKQQTAALDMAESVGMQVFDPKLGEMRPVQRMGERFFPNMPKRGIVENLMHDLKSGNIAAGDHPPSVLRKVMRGNALNTVIDHWIEKGIAKTREEALVKMNELFDPSLNGFFAGGEMARGELWPEGYRENNPARAMKSYLAMMWRRIGEVGEFGQNETALKAHLKAIELESPMKLRDRNTQQAKDFYKRVFGQDWVNPIARMEGNYTTLTKMALGFNAIKQLSTGGTTSAVFGPIKTLKGMAKQFSDPETRRIVRESGAVQEDYYQNFADTVDRGIGGTLTSAGLKLSGITAADKLMRNVHGATTLWALRDGIKHLRDKPTGFESNRLRRLFTDQLEVPEATLNEWTKTGEIPNDWMDRLLVRSVRRFQFENDPFTRTVWGHSAFGRMMTRLKSFSIQQARLWATYVIPEARRGNLWPIVAIVGASVGTGELYTAIRNKALDRERPDEDLLTRLGNDIISAGTFGLLTDVLRTNKSGDVVGIEDAMMPSGLESVKNVATGVNRALFQPPKRDAKLSVTDRIKRQLDVLAGREVTVYRNVKEGLANRFKGGITPDWWTRKAPYNPANAEKRKQEIAKRKAREAAKQR